MTSVLERCRGRASNAHGAATSHLSSLLLLVHRLVQYIVKPLQFYTPSLCASFCFLLIPSYSFCSLLPIFFLNKLSCLPGYLLFSPIPPSFLPPLRLSSVSILLSKVTNDIPPVTADFCALTFTRSTNLCYCFVLTFTLQTHRTRDKFRSSRIYVEY